MGGPVLSHALDTLPLDDQVHVLPRPFGLADVTSAKEAGFRTLINNRPDGEDPAQPAGDEVAAVARAEGLAYAHVPMPPLWPDETAIAAMREGLGRGGPVLIFCRSGTRSTLLWALARQAEGWSTERIAGGADALGLDVRPLLKRAAAGP